jgi:hypothetical protein
MPYKDPNDPRKKANQARNSRNYYEKNKAKVQLATNKVRGKARDQWKAFKSTLKCALCSENHTVCLDFHHTVRDPSNRRVSLLVKNGNFALAIKEIREKCVVLCANCHRKGHYYEHYGIPLDDPNYHQYEEWFIIKSTKPLDTP